MQSHRSHTLSRRVEPWIALALCVAVLAARGLEHLVRDGTAYAQISALDWLALAATGFTAAGIIRPDGSPRWLRAQRALRWCGLLLMVWTANGLPFDLLRMTRLIPLDVDWPGLGTRTLALAAATVLAHLALTSSPASASARLATWYGYAAFVLALPYPVLRTWWAFGGTLGLLRPGAAGHGWIPWLACIPWLLAAALSLLLVSTWRWMPRRLLLATSWFATAFVALIGPAACWSLMAKLAVGGDLGLQELGIATWVPCLFYGSWLLWAMAAAAATHSYQLRRAAWRCPPDTATIRSS